MHEYAVAGHEREKTYFFVAAGSIAISAGAAFVARKYGYWIATPSALAIFWGLLLSFDHLLWHSRWLHRIGVVPIPDIRGVWDGVLVSSLDPSEIPVTVIVHQTYRRIRLRLETVSSYSHSHMASLERVDPEQFVLRWEYLAEPKGPIDPGSDRFRHFGVTALVLGGSQGCFKAQQQRATYYTESRRHSAGTIALRHRTTAPAS